MEQIAMNAFELYVARYGSPTTGQILRLGGSPIRLQPHEVGPSNFILYL